MTYPEAIDYLSAARRFGMKLGLEPMQGLAGCLGNPQAGLRFIHIAGSNGKGSTAAFCEAALRAGGYRVGLFTSPHLASIRERIQVDRVPISEFDFAEGMTAVRAAAEGEPTFFELMTALALWHFPRAKADWVVWETGLGGRLDATNIVRPAVSIITNISLEHTQYLGKTLEAIAREKAGIIKRGVPVVSAVTGPARGVIVEECRRLSTELHEIDLVEPSTDHEISLAGSHQARNAACARLALQLLPDPIDEASISRGLAQTKWPGRFDIVSESPLTVLDGAHNVAAMETLIENWNSLMACRGRSGERAHLLFGAVTDKDIAEMARLLLPITKRVSLVRLASERSANPADLVPYFPGVECELLDSVAAFKPGVKLPVLVTGSLFLVGEVLARRLGVQNDLGLNERLESPQVAP